jgi:hypothetical protein
VDIAVLCSIYAGRFRTGEAKIPRIGRRASGCTTTLLFPLVASVGAAFASVPAAAQSLAPVEQRIDAVFQNLPDNPRDIAVPLSRRALAKRASVLPYAAEQASDLLDGFRWLEAPPDAPEQDTAAAPTGPETDDVEEGSADADAKDEAVRIPPPRPDPMAEGEVPIDLVAAPPGPATETATGPDLIAAPAPPPGEGRARAPVTASASAAQRPEPASLDGQAVAAVPEPLTEPASSAEIKPPARVESNQRPAEEPVAPVTSVAKASGVSPPLPEPDPATIAALGSSAPAEDTPPVPPPRPDREASEGGQEAPQIALAAAQPSGPCLAPDKVADKDKDFSRNAEALKEPGFCITEQKFKERKRPWTVQTVTSGRPGPLWAVLHDDEHESFDTAVHALQTYGGVLVTLDTGGKRNQDGIDPNRNFSDDEISCPKLGKSAAPKFTAVFKDLLGASQPVIALHNNFDGPVPTNGLGHVSMSTVPKDMRKVASKDPDSPLAGEHALLLLAALEPVNEGMKGRMQTLAGRGLNVVLEPVREGKGDCSLSNHAVLSGHEDYFNVTVHHGEGDKQRKMIAAIMAGFPTVSASR